MKFKSKPVVIEAMQFIPENAQALIDWLPYDVYALVPKPTSYELDLTVQYEKILEIKTLEGVMTARTGDWIIKGTLGEFYPCKDEVFRKKYEPV